MGLSDREVEVLRAVLSEANATDLPPSKYYANVTETELEDLYYRLPPLFSVHDERITEPRTLDKGAK